MNPTKTATLLAVLGVVYGDIGTSPLYALKASLHLFSTPITETEILGVLSLIFWSLIVIVSIKYVVLVMRADNRGEGGILALMALAQRAAIHPRTREVLGLIGIAGACLFFGDGIITPAISVLSAVEGLEISAPNLQQFVLPISAIIIILLFAVQHRGTSRIGTLFGPVMLIWFGALAALGVSAIAQHPSVLLALSPSYALQLCIMYKGLAFVVLGAVVLCVTGAEALYADMGHFGATPIRLTWAFGVLPALVLNYFGQGALLLTQPQSVDSPFFLLAPEWLRLPMVVLATVATVIASQALITGAYSVTRQCIQMGFLPRMTIRHTSTSEEGQIFVPQVNAMLMIGVLILVFGFKTSENLASAYGIAVTGTFMCTAVLAVLVFRRCYHWPWIATLSVFGSLFLIDATFFASNTLKFVEGGWVPVMLGLLLATAMTSWKRGRDLMLARWRQDTLPMTSFLARLAQSRTIRVPGLAIFLTSNPDYVPTALLHNLKHNKVLHESILFVTVRTVDEPEVALENRAETIEMSPGIYSVVLHYGFMESPNIPHALAKLGDAIHFDSMQASYFLGREIMVAATVPKMPWWRLWLFLTMSRNAVSATEFFRIPSDRVVELGVRVTI